MKVRLILLFAALLGLSNSGLSQTNLKEEDFRKRILYADSVTEHVDFDINMIKRTTDLGNQPPEELSLQSYNLAICYVAKGQVDSAFYFLFQAVRLSSDYNHLVYTDTDFYILRQYPKWDMIVQKIDSAHFSKNPDIKQYELSKELYHIYLMDQHVRGLGLKNKVQKTNNVDIMNLQRVEEIIKQYGWPTFSMVGITAATGAFLVIQHSSPQIQQKYLMMLMEAAKSNEAHKEWVALLVDRISVTRMGIQIFGTQVYQIEDSLTGKPGKYQYFPIKDEAIVDSLRIAFGMIPIKDYYAIFGIDYKPNIK